MNQNDNQLIIEVRAIVDNVVELSMKNHRDFAGGTIGNLDMLFTLGRCHSDYVAHEFLYEFILLGDGTDYYRSLTSAVFEDEKGFAVSANNSIAIYDHAKDKRIYVIVLEKGNNIVLHDLYPRGKKSDRKATDTAIVASSKIDHEGILGIHPRWINDCIYDLAMCSKMFGFTFDRLNNVVDVPAKRCANWFKAHGDQLIPYNGLGDFVLKAL